MEHKNLCPVAIHIFDGRTFQRQEMPNTLTGLIYCRYLVDGIECTKEQWEQQRQIALDRDLASLGLKRDE